MDKRVSQEKKSWGLTKGRRRRIDRHEGGCLVHGWEISPFMNEPGFVRPTGTSEFSLFGSAHQPGDLDADSFQDLRVDDFDHNFSDTRGPTQHISRLSDGNYKPVSSLDAYCDTDQGESANHYVQGMAISEEGPEDIVELNHSSESQADCSGVGEETRPGMRYVQPAFSTNTISDST